MKAFSIIAMTILLNISMVVASEQTFRQRISTQHKANLENIDFDNEVEAQLGRKIAVRILGEYPLGKNMRLNEYITIIGRGIARYSSRPELNYYFAILDTDKIMTYSTPGGYVFISRGALQAMQNEAELAALLAHEIAHITEKHILHEIDTDELPSTEQEDDSLETGLLHFLGSAKDPADRLLSRMIEQSMNILLYSGLKKEHEYEADRIAQQLIAKTGYDSRALYQYIKRINDNSPKLPPPLLKERQRRLYKSQIKTGLVGRQVKDRFNYYRNNPDQHSDNR